jgi:hypothetical protein
MWVGSASPHFWRTAASMSTGGFQTAAALTRVTGCGVGFAGSCATAQEDAANKIARTNPIRVMSPSRRMNCYLGSPYARNAQKVKKDFPPRHVTRRRATSHPLVSLYVAQKNGAGLRPPHAMSSRAHPATSPLLRRSRDPNLVRAGNIDVPQLGPDAVRAQVALPFRRSLGIPAKEILVLQDRVQLFQERRKSNRRL